MTTKTIKIGDLTLRQFKELLYRECPWSCLECKEKHNADYVICKISSEYDFFTDNMLDQEIEVDSNDESK